MSDSVRPHRWQPTRLPIPGILQARTHWSGLPFPSPMHENEVKVKSLSHIRLLATPWTSAYQAPPPWDFPGKSSGVGCHCLLPPFSSFVQICLPKDSLCHVPAHYSVLLMRSAVVLIYSVFEFCLVHLCCFHKKVSSVRGELFFFVLLPPSPQV